MKFTDSHCHLDFDEFSLSLTDLLSQCISLGIHRLVVPSISPNNWQKTLELCAEQANKQITLLSALGIHPWYLNELNNNVLDTLSEQVQTNISSIIAIGETGIDGTIAEQHNNLDKQILFFEYQLALAKKHQLPVIVHHRKSHQHILHQLKKYPNVNGVIHAFSGSYAQAKDYIDLGFKLGIGGTITYERAQKTINTLTKLPIESIVLETDAPSMPLSGYQGTPNSPIRIIDVFEKIAELRKVLSKENRATLAAQLENNCNALFNLR